MLRAKRVRRFVRFCHVREFHCYPEEGFIKSLFARLKKIIFYRQSRECRMGNLADLLQTVGYVNVVLKEN